MICARRFRLVHIICFLLIVTLAGGCDNFMGAQDKAKVRNVGGLKPESGRGLPAGTTSTKALAPPAPGAPGYLLEKKELAEQSRDETAGEGEETNAQTTTSAQAATGLKLPTRRYIVRSAQIKLQVAAVARALDTLTRLVTRFKGFASDSNLDTESSSTPTGNITLRVPAESLDQAVAQIVKLGTILSQSMKGEDITREFVDTAARLRNLRREEDQYLRIMAMARTVKDVLPVAKELARVRGEVERTQGQLQHMAGLVDLATITVTLLQKEITPPPPNLWDFGSRWSNAWQNGVQRLADSIGRLVEGLAGLMTALPLLLGILTLYLLFGWLIGLLLVRRLNLLTRSNFIWVWVAVGYVILGANYPVLFGLLLAVGLVMVVIWLGHVVYRRFTKQPAA